MADLKIPTINKSKQYLFKNKLKSGSKYRIELIRESFWMIFIASFLLALNHLIPDKYILFRSFNSNLKNIYDNIISLIINLYEILLVVFVIVSALVTFILFVGAIIRLVKIFRRKKRKTNYM